MGPSHLHYNNLNVEDFKTLMPEHAKSAGIMAQLLESYARRKRCRNVIDQAGLAIKHMRILEVEKDSEILSQENYDRWYKEDQEDETKAISYEPEEGEPE